MLLESVSFDMMRIFGLNKKALFIVFLTMMVSIPCALKREFKEFLKIETNQSPSSGVNKAPCKTVCSFDQKVDLEQAERKIPPVKTWITKISESTSVIKAANEHSQFKEKVPTYLRNREILI